MPNLTAKSRALGVLGGASTDPMLLAAWARSANFVAGADSGADALLKAGITPDLVVGDLDSLVSERHLFDDLRHLPDQDATDCDKLLAVLDELGFDAVTLANVEGDLPDHVLATFHSAARSRLTCRLLLARGFGHILVGPFSGEFQANGRVSLLPLGVCREVHLDGVRWPLSAVELDPMGFTSISNQAIAGTIHVTIGEGPALLFIEGATTPSWPRIEEI